MSSQKSYNTGLLILRASIGILMLLHGIAKLLHGVDGISGMLSAKGIPGFVAYGVFVGEIIAPVLLVIGYRTRLAALVFAVNMVVAVMLAHAGDIFSLSATGGWAIELAGLYFFGSLALLFTGGGKFAVSSRSWWD